MNINEISYQLCVQAVMEPVRDLSRHTIENVAFELEEQHQNTADAAMYSAVAKTLRKIAAYKEIELGYRFLLDIEIPEE